MGLAASKGCMIAWSIKFCPCITAAAFEMRCGIIDRIIGDVMMGDGWLMMLAGQKFQLLLDFLPASS